MAYEMTMVWSDFSQWYEMTRVQSDYGTKWKARSNYELMGRGGGGGGRGDFI